MTSNKILTVLIVMACTSILCIGIKDFFGRPPPIYPPILPLLVAVLAICSLLRIRLRKKNEWSEVMMTAP
jgi:4-hydroxybenzoate polyprenyltransferase